MLTLHGLPTLVQRCGLGKGDPRHMTIRRLRSKFRRVRPDAPKTLLLLKHSAKYIPNRVFLVWLKGQLDYVPHDEKQSAVKIVVSTEKQLQAELEWYAAHWEEVWYKDERELASAKSKRMEALRRLGKYNYNHYGTLLSKVRANKCYSLLEDILDIGVNVVWQEYKEDGKALSLIIQSYLARNKVVIEPPCSELLETSAIWRRDPRVVCIFKHHETTPGKYLPPYYGISDAEVPSNISERKLLPNLRFRPDEGYPRMEFIHSQKAQENPVLRAVAILVLDGATPSAVEALLRDNYTRGDVIQFLLLVSCCAGRMDVFAQTVSKHKSEVSASWFGEFGACAAYCGQTMAVQMLARMDASPFFIAGGAIERGIQYNTNEFFVHCYPAKPRSYRTSFFSTILLELLQDKKHVAEVRRIVDDATRRGDLDLLRALHPVFHQLIASDPQKTKRQLRLHAANTGKTDVLRFVCETLGETLAVEDYRQLSGWFSTAGIDMLLREHGDKVTPVQLLGWAITNFVVWSTIAVHAMSWLTGHIHHLISKVPSEQKDAAYRATISSNLFPANGTRFAVCNCGQKFGSSCHISDILALLLRECGIGTEEVLQNMMGKKTASFPYTPFHHILCPNLVHQLIGSHPCTQILDDLYRSKSWPSSTWHHGKVTEPKFHLHLYLLARGCTIKWNTPFSPLSDHISDPMALTIYGFGNSREPEKWGAERIAKLDQIKLSLSQLTCEDLANLALAYC